MKIEDMKLTRQVYGIFFALLASILGVAYWILTIGDGAPGLNDAGGKFDSAMRLYTPLSSQQVGTIALLAPLGAIIASLIILMGVTGWKRYLTLLWAAAFIAQFFIPAAAPILVLFSILMMVTALFSFQEIKDRRFLITVLFILALGVLGMISDASALLMWGLGIWNNASHVQYTWLNQDWITSLWIAFVLLSVPALYGIFSVAGSLRLMLATEKTR